MLSWLSANLASILICAALAVIVVAILVNLIRKRKRGESGCGCGCGGCPMSGACGKNGEKQK